jgi:hypothetical protein
MPGPPRPILPPPGLSCIPEKFICTLASFAQGDFVSMRWTSFSDHSEGCLSFQNSAPAKAGPAIAAAELNPASSALRLVIISLSSLR